MNSEQVEQDRKMSDMTSAALTELRTEGKLCDVVIKTEEVEFNAHKIILCGCSSYFRTLFTGAWASSGKQVHTIPGVSPEMMHLIINYAYTASVSLNDDNVLDVLEAADQFLIPGMVQKCCSFLENQLCLLNCMTILRVVDFYHCPELRDKALQYILQHFEEISLVSQEFLEVSVHLLEFIIENDYLSVKDESVVFEAVLRWINHRPDERRGLIAQLLPKVRLGLLNDIYLRITVFLNPFVRGNLECVPILRNATAAIREFRAQRRSDLIYRNLLTRPRMPHSILLVAGGKDGFTPALTLEAYDPRADRWVTMSTEGVLRAHHGAAVLNDFMYLVGGCNTNSYLSSVVKINLPSNTWHQVASLSQPRCYVSIAVLNGCIYAMGGCTGRHTLNSVECYSPETDRWVFVAPMHVKRSGASATTLNGKVYICGGHNGVRCVCTAECYDPETNTWRMIAHMRIPRCGLGVAAYHGKIYAIGGLFRGYNYLIASEVYTPHNDNWQLMPRMSTQRSYFGIEVVDDQLFVIGGYDRFNTMLTVQRYEEEARTWVSAAPIEMPRSGLSCCVLTGHYELNNSLFPRPQLSEEAAGGSS